MVIFKNMNYKYKIILLLFLFEISNEVNAQKYEFSFDSTSQDCIKKLFSISSDSLNGIYNKKIIVDEYGIKYCIDSMNFNIIKKFTKDSVPVFEEIYNILNRLTYIKKYNILGKIKEEGYSISSHNTYIGVWKYYSSRGTLYKIIDYDRRQESYCSVLEFVKEVKLYNQNSYLSFNKKKKKWSISNSVNNGSSVSAEIYEFNPKTKKISHKILEYSDDKR